MKAVPQRDYFYCVGSGHFVIVLLSLTAPRKWTRWSNCIKLQFYRLLHITAKLDLSRWRQQEDYSNWTFTEVEELWRERRKLHDKKLQGWCFSLDIVEIFKSMGAKRTTHIFCI